MDEHGKLIFDTVDLCVTWEVSTGLREHRTERNESKGLATISFMGVGYVLCVKKLRLFPRTVLRARVACMN